MKRLAVWAILVLGTFVLVRRLKQALRTSPRFPEIMADRCERMMARMPSSFPPNRMMADLETVKARTALILEALDDATGKRPMPAEVLTQDADRSVHAAAGVAHDARH